MDADNLKPYQNRLGLKNRMSRFVWGLVYHLLFRPFRLRIFNRWRLFLLRCFGARHGRGCVAHATAEVWAPWNLEMGHYVCLGPFVRCYSADRIVLGSKVTVSQYSYLCTATHDISSLERPLVTKPIVIDDHVWVCADAFVGPGVTVGQGAVVGARAVVTKDVAPWTVVAGNPARFIKDRVIEER